ncbi:hypothetical protein G6F56_003356 [Rhizopus delemar]|nr:hypothetical protein G6F56_003356 [Rhizopus delemar]
MVVATNLGFPYVGSQRELKKSVEAYWSGKITADDLKAACLKIQEAHWKLQKEQGLEHIPSGEFTLYDRVLDTAHQFGAIPQRYQHIKDPLQQFFAMGRGLQKPATETTEKIDVPAQEMKKWFDTNYHFIVPELEPNQTFQLSNPRAVEQYNAAKALGIETRPVLIGPVTFLHVAKAAKGFEEFDTLTLLPKLLPLYVELIKQLEAAGAQWVQIDEPALIYDLPAQVKAAFEESYKTIQAQTNIKVLVAAYFGRVEDNVNSFLPYVDALHLDLVRAPQELDIVLPLLKNNQVLSLGLVDGRNIWINNLAQSIEVAQKAVNALGQDRVFIAPSCSLAHSPFSTVFEKKIAAENAELFSWLSFSVEKTQEIATIAKAVRDGADSVKDILAKNAAAVESRRTSPQTVNTQVRDRAAKIPAEAWKRPSAFPVRREAQVKKLQLPLFPTTTIGSFPQTKEIRVARQKFNKGQLSAEEYDAFIKSEMKKMVEFQEKVGLDVLVHGEPERNDMVEHFGHHLHGYGFTENGWVVSYGSRCVKPPVIYGDVSRQRLLEVFKTQGYPQEVGPGVFDIHSPRVPGADEMKEKIDGVIKYIPKERVWVNPDCGLKTRGWAETEAALVNMVQVAKQLRTLH